MNVTVEPPMSRWRLAPPGRAERDGLIAAINDNAAALGTARIEKSDALVATGHQAWLWHPGILAKYLALTRAAGTLHATPFHLVVDQDTHEALRLELPVQQGDRLVVEAIQLAGHDANIPTGCQPPADARAIVNRLKSFRGKPFGGGVDLTPIAEAFENLPECGTLARQVAVVLARLMRPYTGDLPMVTVTDLCRQDFFRGMVERMTSDAGACVAAYNRAAAAVPEARIGQLLTEADRVELPLWLLEWQKPRQRVFADLADSGRPILTVESGRAIDPSKEMLAPRAVTLSVLLRGWACDLFIHGKGGGVYDRVTEAWWQTWTGETLAPMAVVSADVALDLGVPLAEPRELERAVWWMHHLPANVDRAAAVDGPSNARKRDLLAHMADDRDRIRRAEAFREIHRINEDLARAHPALFTQAKQQIDRARTGVANRSIAGKRDWCFALYPPDGLRRLAATMVS